MNIAGRGRKDMDPKLKWLVYISIVCAQGALQAQTFGERQLEQVLDDRPAMRGIIDSGDPLLSWFASQFSNGPYGSRVHWDFREPTGGYDSTMVPPSDEMPGLIRVSSAPSLTGRDQWCLLAYELQNVQNAPKIVELTARAVRGDIGREAFAIECIRLEHAAVLRTRELLGKYKSLGEPEARSKRYGRIGAMPPDFAQYLTFLDSRPDTQYRNHFRLYYDRLTGNPRDKIGNDSESSGEPSIRPET